MAEMNYRELTEIDMGWRALMESGFSAGLSAWKLLLGLSFRSEVVCTSGFEEEVLMSGDAPVESWVGGQIQAAGIGARG